MNWEEGWRANRFVNIFSYIDQNMSENVIKQLFGYATVSKDPITILINTEGGQIFHGLAIVQAIESLDVPVFTIGIGRVYSCGVMILVSGKKRGAFKNTIFMSHEFTDNTPEASYETIKLRMKANKWLYGRLIDHFTKYTKIKNKTKAARFFLSRDNYFDTETAAKVGIIDHVIDRFSFVAKEER